MWSCCLKKIELYRGEYTDNLDSLNRFSHMRNSTDGLLRALVVLFVRILFQGSTDMGGV